MFNKKQKQEVVLVFDIGSASVGGALVLFSERSKPKVIYNTRHTMPVYSDFNIKDFEKSMFRVFDSVVSDIEKNGIIKKDFLKLQDKKINKGYCFFSSPWYVSQTSTIKIQKNKKFKITKELLDSTIEKQEQDFFDSEQNTFKNKNNIEIIDRKIIQTKIDGKISNNPFGKETNLAEISISLGFLPKKLINKIKDINNIFHVKEIYAHSFVLPVYLSLRDMFEKEDDFFFVDMSGEITDISFVKKGLLKETESFPIGKNAFIRLLKNKFNISDKQALSMLQIYSSDKSDQKTSSTIDKLFEEIKIEWVGLFEDSILDLLSGAISPQNIFIIADNDIVKLIYKLIKTTKFKKLIFSDIKKKLNPVIIDAHKIDSMCDFEDKENRDVFICLEADFLNR